MLHEPVTLSAHALTTVIRDLNLGIPHPVIAETAVWHEPDDARAERDRAWSEFDRHRLTGRTGDLRDEVIDSLRVLTSAPTEYYAVLTHHGTTLRVLVAAIGRDALLAIRHGAEVDLRPIRPESLATTLIAQLPEHPPARADSITLPQAEFLATHPDPRALAARHKINQLRSAPATGSGELHAATRDRNGTYRTSHPLSYLDTPTGRWLLQLDTRQRAPWIIAAPATPHLLTQRLTQLHNTLT